ncbi:hypothetical protein [Intestinimonas butyriciproducens]|uniref:hypothetical protein n=1 Tax=Intestinimonas butyriciproducens TaxID=1297617 RepID=UPI001FAEC2BF|nr:hypothetical protein [Intestinimonas butyriciproducens]
MEQMSTEHLTNRQQYGKIKVVCFVVGYAAAEQPKLFFIFGGTKHGSGPWPYWDAAFAVGPADNGKCLFRLCGNGYRFSEQNQNRYFGR